MSRLAPALILAAVLSSTILAIQPSGSEARLAITEGTSMAAAASPDGRTIVIDLLGALWTVPLEGGRARRILADGYDARLPAWSPDGRRIVFQAYRDSTWNIWTVASDGSNLRRETSGPFDDREPVWSPDGTRVAFSSDRGGNYDVWTLTLASGEVRQLTSNPANDSMPAWSPDGREIVFVSDRRERGLYAIDAAAGVERTIANDARAVASPVFAQDGKTVVYPAVDAATSLLVAGTVNIADAGEDVFPFRVTWLAAREVLYTADGAIKRRSLDGGPARRIPFEAEIVLPATTFTPRARLISPESSHPALGLMHPAISPDGRRVAFVALGDLWLADAARGSVVPQRLTHDAFVEADPVWSPDGTRLAFSSDRDGSMDLWIHELATAGDRKLASRALAAAWAPDGADIAYLNPQSELHVVSVASGETRRARERLNEPGRPSWAPDGTAVVMSTLRPYSTRFREGVNQVLWVPIDRRERPSPPGRSERWFTPVAHKAIGMRESSGPVWSPDGTQMAAIVDGHLVAWPVSRDGTPLGSPRRLSSNLASTPSWTGDSRSLLYQTPGRFHLVDVVTGRIRDIVPQLSWTPAAAGGTKTVHAGRFFDGRASDIRDNIDIVIEGRRIARIEPHRPELHQGEVIDASNQTVLPGLIESHAHLTKGYGEALGRILLAFGITTVRNPAANPFEAIEDREAFASGVRAGPRVFLTGEPFDGTRIYYPGGAALDGGAQLGQQLAHVRDLGFDFVKTYVRLPDLLQQRVIEDAHALGLPVTSHEIYPAVAYGADGVEHIRGTSRRGFSPKMSELRRSYGDVVTLLTRSRMTITPTITIQGGYQVLALADAPWLADPRLTGMFPASATEPVRALRKTPPAATEIAAREALVTPQERFVATVVKNGGRVIAGTDAPINPYGLSLLLEIEHYVRGGLSPAEAIRTATSVPAEAMGLGADLGTIEVGKLADLTIVDGNPLVSIVDLRRTRIVIRDGAVFTVDGLLRRPSARAE
jgi:Tol biopolymer transport system component/imidazolonepropionase-like amidohydrolase